MTEQSRQLATRIQDEHERLEQMIADMRAELASPVDPSQFVDWKLGFIWKVRDFQNELRKHFDLEEDGGFMEDVVSKAPRFTPRVRALEDDHAEALTLLDTITSNLKGMDGFDPEVWTGVKDSISALFDSLEEHEAAERDLILEVYYQDIGVGD
jgi:uncharacterized protein (UPF0335 family)